MMGIWLRRQLQAYQTDSGRLGLPFRGGFEVQDRVVWIQDVAMFS